MKDTIRISNCNFCGVPLRIVGRGALPVYCKGHRRAEDRLPALPPKECPACKKQFIPKRGRGSRRRRYCSNDCARGSYTRRNSVPTAHLSKVSVGALHEIVVSCDLMLRGFSVYRAISPGSSCDLLILMDSQVKRVEVTTGYLSSNGTVIHPTKNKERSDILAVVYYDPTGKTPIIFYRPGFLNTN